MKSKVFSTFIVSICMLTLCVPVYASSSDWDFTMKYRYVSGKSNDEYHRFDEDDSITINGDLNYSATSWQVAEIDPNNITVVLYRDKAGSDKKIGSYTISSPDSNGSTSLSKSFNKKLGTADTTSDDYYLVFFKTEDEGWDVSGSGGLSD